MKRAPLMTAAAALIMASGLASAADQPGSFPGVAIDAKIIGGEQYEPLYTRIGEWEKLTGAKVNILTKKNGFDIDKEFKSDIAANSVNWCVGWNHTSFAPQYTSLYTDLIKLVPKEEIDKYVPAIIKGATIDGKLNMLPRAQFDVSALYYLKSNYTDDAKKKAFKEKYGYDLAPPDHLAAGERSGDLLLQSAEFLRHASSPARKRRSTAASTKCWSRKAANISIRRTASRPSIRTPACARFNGSSISTRPRRSRRHYQLSLGRSRPGLRVRHGRARSGLAELGRLLQRPEEIEGRRQCRRQSCSPPDRRESIPAGRAATASR